MNSCLPAKPAIHKRAAIQFTKPQSPKGRLEFLDAIRGIAALCVVLYHLLALTTPGLRRFTLDTFNLGDFGVYAFFLVSGFIIPVSLERHHSLRSFWTSRFWRLFPAFWFSLIVGLGVITIWPGDALPAFWLHPLRYAVVNATMFAVLLRTPLVLGVYWTLTIELLFYGVASGLLVSRLLPRRRLVAWVSVALYAVVTLAFAKVTHGSATWFHADYAGLLLTALLGSAIYAAYLRGEPLLKLAPLTAITLGVILAGLWLREQRPFGPVQADNFSKFWPQASAWIAATIFFYLLLAMRNLRFPRPVLRLGRVSYSLYLLHVPAIQLASHLHLSARWSRVAAIVLSLVFADVAYRLVEKPSADKAARVYRTPTRTVPASS